MIDGLKIPKWYQAKAPRTGPSLTNVLNLLLEDGVEFGTIGDMAENQKKTRREAKLERDGSNDTGRVAGRKPVCVAMWRV